MKKIVVKKVFSFVVAIIICFGALLSASSLFCARKINFASADVDNHQDLIGINPQTPSQTSNDVPINRETGEKRDGVSIVPTCDEYNQINQFSIGVNSFSYDAGKSVFVWFYFPDEPQNNLYSLSVEFKNSNNETLSWFIYYDDLKTLISSNGNFSCGWKRLEFPLKSGYASNSSDEEIDSFSSKFTSFSISYKMESEITDFSKSTGKLLIYYMVLDDIVKDNVNVNEFQSYVCYKISDAFYESFDNLFVGDNYDCLGITEVFDYLVVGNSNMLLTIDNSIFSWKLTLTIDGSIQAIDWRSSTKISSEGLCKLQIVLNQKMFTRNFLNMEFVEKEQAVLSVVKSFYVPVYEFCKTFKDSYKVAISEKLRIPIEILDDFTLAGDISLNCSNANNASAELVFVDGSYYIVVDALKKGESEIEISVLGNREGFETKNHSKTIYISVVKPNQEITLKRSIIIWIFAIYLVGIAIYLVILFVKSRKNDVK